MKTTPMRKAARGEECQLRLDCCNYDTETTILCHLRINNWGGMSLKPYDFLAVYACYACHLALDRVGNGERVSDTDILRALGNTLIRQYELGNLTVKGERR